MILFSEIISAELISFACTVGLIRYLLYLFLSQIFKSSFRIVQEIERNVFQDFSNNLIEILKSKVNMKVFVVDQIYSKNKTL